MTTTTGVFAPMLDWKFTQSDYALFNPAETVAVYVTREEGELLMTALDSMVTLEMDADRAYALYQKVGPQVLLARTEGTS